MELNFTNNGKNYTFNSDNFFEISVPVEFNGKQPNTYNVPLASSSPYKDGNFIGDTRLGGSCNFEVYIINPHCNGTHTECAGHISNERLSISETLKQAMLSALLITVEPIEASLTTESYLPNKNDNDKIITKQSIEEKLKINTIFNFNSLIIRTLPNSSDKKIKNYTEQPPPFLSNEAASLINEAGIKHLILDIPSLDRAFDEGMLSNHHIFWNMEQRSHEIKVGATIGRTITEMAYIDEKITDGVYLLNIQIPHFIADAAPSRLLLFPIH